MNSAKHSSGTVPFILHNPWCRLFYSFSRSGNWGSKKLSIVSQLGINQRLKSQGYLIHILSSEHCFLLWDTFLNPQARTQNASVADSVALALKQFHSAPTLGQHQLQDSSITGLLVCFPSSDFENLRNKEWALDIFVVSVLSHCQCERNEKSTYPKWSWSNT